MTAFVLFRLGSRRYAADLAEVAEVVRARGLEPVPAAAPPARWLLELRGEPVPVADARTPCDGAQGVAGQHDADRTPAEPPRHAQRGDVLVLATSPAGRLGVAVDEVLEVVDEHELPLTGSDVPAALPPHVTQARRSAADGGCVLVVRLAALAERCAA